MDNKKAVQNKLSRRDLVELATYAKRKGIRLTVGDTVRVKCLVDHSPGRLKAA